MKGFVEGGFWALILGGLGLSVVSLANEQPVFAQGPAAPQLVAPELTPDTSSTSVSVTVTKEPAPEFLAQAPRVADPVLDDVAPDVSTQSAELPLVADVETALDAPADAAPATLSSDVDDAVSAPLVSEAPQTPQTADAMDVVTPSPSVKSPEAVTEVIVIESPSAEAAQDPEVDAPLIVILETPPPPIDELIITEDPAASKPPQVQTEAADTVVAEVMVEEPQAPATVTATTPLPDTVILGDQEISDPAPSIVVIEPAPEPTPQPEPEIIIAQDEAEGVAAPQTNTQVRVNRLAVTPSDDDDAVETDAAPEQIAPALERFATDFENPDNLPVISIVLLDDGAADVAGLADLGFAPTIAVDALAQGARSRADAYRAAGFEVAMQISLPEGAQPSDVEITFQSAFDIVPEAAMLFSDGTGVVQNNRSVTAQVMEILAAEGRGFVTVQRGLGGAARTAQDEGIPSAVIQRDLDAGGEDARAITRGLDQAAVRARQTGGVVLLARMKPETFAALRDWAAGNDQDTLLIAPASAVLLAASE